MRERLCAERVHTGWKLATADGTYTALYSFHEGECRVVARTVAMTAQAQTTHAALEELVPETWRLLEIEYPCVYSATIAYPADAFRPHAALAGGARAAAVWVLQPDSAQHGHPHALHTQTSFIESFQ